LDIEAVQYFYGKPFNSSQEFIKQPATLIHTSTIIAPENLGKKIVNRLFQIYLVGDDLVKDNIKSVTYHLDKTFRKKTVKVKNGNDNFGLGLRVWGEFEITADVHFKDGRIETLRHFLNFLDNEAKEPD